MKVIPRFEHWCIITGPAQIYTNSNRMKLRALHILNIFSFSCRLEDLEASQKYIDEIPSSWLGSIGDMRLRMQHRWCKCSAGTELQLGYLGFDDQWHVQGKTYNIGGIFGGCKKGGLEWRQPEGWTCLRSQLYSAPSCHVHPFKKKVLC